MKKTNGRSEPINTRINALHQRFDAMQVDNSRQHDDPPFPGQPASFLEPKRWSVVNLLNTV